jgi:hypothetical protein
VSAGEGVAEPDVGVKTHFARDEAKGVMWKFSCTGTERTRRWGRGVGDVDMCCTE